METKKQITVVGASEHNLKNVTVSIPKESLTVITGPSGSGKSTLALDVLYAEGQRRYIESLSSYARQFLGIPAKPQVERIDGLCPAIAIDQKTVGANPRSTVGTITEIYDHLRVLYARIGELRCPGCKQSVRAESPQTIAERLKTMFAGQKVMISAPIVIDKKGEFTDRLEQLFLAGFCYFVVDGKKVTFKSPEDIKKLTLKKTYKHSIDIIIDTFEVTDDEHARMHEALERAFTQTDGLCKVTVGEHEHVYSSKRMCIACARSFPEIEPRLFSFNSPSGACNTCHGLGVVYGLSYMPSRYELEHFEDRVMERTCPDCHGRRLHELALSVTVNNLTIFELADLSVKHARAFLQSLPLSMTQHAIADRLIREIVNRYSFLCDVGLPYLSLNRTSRTLSGGESQRIRLATQIGSALSGVLYVLDEPSIGLHQRDNDRLIATLKKLRDQGNTVLVVEHDIDMMHNADHIIDMGPAAGIHGGHIVAAGTPQEVAQSGSLTGTYLAGTRVITRAQPVRTPNKYLTLANAHAHNLKNISVQFPLEVLCGIAGVSGSGKSTLIIDELVPALQKALAHRHLDVTHDKISGHENLDSLVVIDQAPIGRTSRSNPATYLGIFDDIRKLFASLPESNARGYQVGRFSFNMRQGRCAQCEGDGTLTVSMHFLPDVTITCDRCKGLRYNAQTLEIKYRNKHIADILDMTALEARDFFAAHTAIAKKLTLMCDVGLDYLKLGQPSTTLSGGEAQRIKLVDELAKRGHKTLYILDEPTTGLHAHDIEKLLLVLNKLVDKGNSVIVIEHNIDVLKTMDYLIELGPEGGDEGGYVVAHGTPETLAGTTAGATGAYLKKALESYRHTVPSDKPSLEKQT